jgi:hypothetical protein
VRVAHVSVQRMDAELLKFPEVRAEVDAAFVVSIREFRDPDGIYAIFAEFVTVSGTAGPARGGR